MVIGGPNDVDGNCDSDGQQSMDGELQLPKVDVVGKPNYIEPPIHINLIIILF